MGEGRGEDIGPVETPQDFPSRPRRDTGDEEGSRRPVDRAVAATGLIQRPKRKTASRKPCVDFREPELRENEKVALAAGERDPADAEGGYFRRKVVRGRRGKGAANLRARKPSADRPETRVDDTVRSKGKDTLQGDVSTRDDGVAHPRHGELSAERTWSSGERASYAIPQALVERGRR